jgi:hypothetical protein
MPKLSSGLIIAGAYADKIRRTVFAQLRDMIKEGAIKSSDIAYSIAQLNKLLYSILVENLKVEKGDVVRIMIDYEVSEGKLEWKLDTLKIELFKRVPAEEVQRVLESVLPKAKSIMESIVEYAVERLGETEDGDVVLAIKLGDREVGALVATPINGEFLYIKKAAMIAPSPSIVEKQRIPLDGKTAEEAVRSNIAVLTTSAKYVTDEEARKIYEIIKRRVIPTATVERIREEEE